VSDSGRPTKVLNNFNITKQTLRLSTAAEGGVQLQFRFDAKLKGEGEIYWGCNDSTPPDADPDEIANHGLEIEKVDRTAPDIFKFRKGPGQAYAGACDAVAARSWIGGADVVDLVIRLRGVVNGQDQSQSTFCKLNRDGTNITAFMQKLTYQGYVYEQAEVYGLSDGNGDADGSDANMCVVCYSEPKDCVIVPCGHCCLCFGCATDLANTGSVELRYGEVRTGADAKCPMCRYRIESILHVNDLKNDRKKSGKPSQKDSSSDAQDLPYNGDLQAAMKAQDRPAIRVLMAARDSQSGKPSQNDSSSDAQDLPYDGDLQAAMKAQDRPAIRVLMAARDKT
jgi:hypothetical protein